MKIKEALSMLSKMDPNLEVTILFNKDLEENRNNEHLKEYYNRYGHPEEIRNDR